ncbi:S-adenosylmethionine synthetase [Candidatus Pacearchaeota archaeon CG_4_9_14_3_um_filter_31_7]|nr:MAG: hypothetical protein AUJ10_03300 [Candidatus Pacearchaeota archaeon CG1_02_31_27]PIN92433.1 MAG: S-adenosylmethionine synthetase [Candidatus Pacearchaeota archaeon CG10_big_fil_rev_8_21_14_0_10_31_59]PIZ81018.1 MAG: S-adenosylmethionine synthetase [Candidatus Pacearchaeota archaeon CG_4_10_14_0_2_um_filter_31_10]PJA70514.1 MAG: S-adenosylmethionine synthetase [Candidatus Pacearchaeota archaeon CG_4_9_14_3_um_filter_31_7]
MSNIVIERLNKKPVEEERVEIVESKLNGHPDTICDAISEGLSRELSKFYLEKVGKVLHHNVDKALLIAGHSEPKFGGGKIKNKIKIIVSGRVTKIPGLNTDKLIKKVAHEYFKENNIDGSIFEIKTEVREGSLDLQKVFQQKEMLANDTSFGVGYAPYSRLENIVLKIKSIVESKEVLEKFKFVGRDIKIMGLRQNGNIKITMAVAFVDKYVENAGDYFEKKELLKKHILSKINNHIQLEINTLDNANTKDESGTYLTVSGLSAESGDDGQVGRGNRVNKLITPCRPMSLEAAAGKNPTNHAGKIYNIASNIIASHIIKEVKNVKEVYVRTLSSIGKPISEPQVLSIEYLGNVNKNDIEKMKDIANHWLKKGVVDLILERKVSVF